MSRAKPKGSVVVVRASAPYEVETVLYKSEFDAVCDLLSLGLGNEYGSAAHKSALHSVEMRIHGIRSVMLLKN